MCAPKEGMEDTEKGLFSLENLHSFLMFLKYFSYITACVKPLFAYGVMYL